MEREAAEVDRQLEAAQIENARLENILRQREAEVCWFINYEYIFIMSLACLDESKIIK